MVEGGPALERSLSRGLVAEFLSVDEDRDLTDLLIEALGLLGVSSGDVFQERIAELSLEQLLDLRRRFALRTARDGVDRRIEHLALTHVEEAPSFRAAEERISALPLHSLSASTRLALRDTLYARITPEDASRLYSRLLSLFPERLYPPPEEDHLDQAYIEGAADVLDAGPHVRLSYFEEYLRCAPRAGAAGRLAAHLNLESLLEAEMVTRLRGLDDAAAEDRVLTSITGPRPGPRALQAFGRALVAALGDDASDDQIRALEARHPELPEIAALSRQRGLIRAHTAHTFPVAPGDSEADARDRLGEPDKVHRKLARRDLSPGAFIGGNQRVRGADHTGLRVLDYDNRARVLVRDQRVIRILIDDSRGRFHHGIRTGDSRAQAIESLGRPTTIRGLMFGRELLVWEGIDDGVQLTIAIDGGKVTFLWEEDAEAIQQAVAALWAQRERG